MAVVVAKRLSDGILSEQAGFESRKSILPGRRASS